MRKRLALIIGAAVLAAIIIVIAGAGFFTDRLWFESMGLSQVFWTGFNTTWIVRLLTFGFAAAFLSINYLLAARVLKRQPHPESQLFQVPGGAALTWTAVGAGTILALFTSAAFDPGWTAVQQFLHSFSAGVAADPGYYLFQFPIWRALMNLFQSLLWLALIGAGLIYWISKAFWRQGRGFMLQPGAKFHLTILAVLLFAVRIWGFTLSRQGLVLVESGLLTGIDYTADHILIPAYTILSWIAGACILILIAGLFRRGIRLLAGGVILLFTAWFLAIVVIPAVVRGMVVKPNEQAKEQPYLAKHIARTREAFGLDKFAMTDYPFSEVPPSLDLNSPTLANLRLWDFNRLMDSYDQLQVLRQYYTFNDIDIDRYWIDGRQRQVMLSAREMAPSPEASNWINLHLYYTHGYGIAMNAVSEVNREGQPVFLVGDIPPRILPGVNLPALDRPELYFGETQTGYVIAPSDKREFDYPTEQEERTTRYTGRDGVALDSLWRKVLFALRFGEPNFLLSSAYIKPGSKVLFYRDIMERARKAAPFLAYDSDPYIVMEDGRLYWILDAYTYSDNYPYAARHRRVGLNYMRNPVKVVIDAYNGTIRYYVIDETEPIIGLWQQIFPSLFAPATEMPAGLRRHLRYPEDLFRVQRDMLLTYHMTDVSTFYGREDLWGIPTETAGNTQRELIPYYVTLDLPGEETPGEFVLMQPLKPGVGNRANMIAWMAARCDEEHYGEVIVYQLPKRRIIYGPIQIQSRIAANPEISQLHTLWGMEQSTVQRGNLLVLPFAGDFLYVEPDYIVSKQLQQPELKLVILVYKDRIVYGATAAEALARLTGQLPPPTAPETTATAPAPAAPTTDRQELLRAIAEIEAIIKAQQDALQRQNDLVADLKKQVEQ